MTDRPPAIYRKTLSGFTPDSDAAMAFAQRVRLGEFVTLDGKRPRNIRHHRKYWKLLSVIADNHDRFDTPDKAALAIKYLAGHGDFVPVKGGEETLFVPGSISFAAMDQVAFDGFYDRALAAVCRHILPGMSQQELREEIERLLA